MIYVFFVNNIQTRDQHLENYVVKLNERINIKIVDGIGNSQMIPIADYCNLFGKQQIRRRSIRFLHNISYTFPQYNYDIDKFINEELKFLVY